MNKFFFAVLLCGLFLSACSDSGTDRSPEVGNNHEIASNPDDASNSEDDSNSDDTSNPVNVSFHGVVSNPTSKNDGSACSDDPEINRAFATLYLSIDALDIPSSDEDIDKTIIDEIMAQQVPFDWNKAETGLVCQALGGEGLITVGSIPVSDGSTLSYSVNLIELMTVIGDLTGGTTELVEKNEKLGTITIRLQDCEQLAAIRELPLVDFIDIPYDETGLNERLDDLGACYIASTATDVVTNNDAGEFNPGFYDPLTSTQTYDQYMNDVDRRIAVRMRNHNLNDVYDTYQYFGSGIGVAVVDNGVHPKDVEYLSQGGGSFNMEGYYRPLDTRLLVGESDGPYPLLTDISYVVTISDFTAHGSGMLKTVYSIAPDVNLLSLRATSFNLLIDRSQLNGVARAIVAAADNPEIRIVSMSMISLIHSYEIERAIDYLNSKDKLILVAAGSTYYVIKRIIGVAFPANLPTTISVTGIKDTNETNSGRFLLGQEAHGGIENDFVVDNANASSPATSTTAGMVALLWAINPVLTREEIIDIMIKSSNYYQSQGKKHPTFGWGKIDMLVAVELVRATLN